MIPKVIVRVPAIGQVLVFSVSLAALGDHWEVPGRWEPECWECHYLCHGRYLGQTMAAICGQGHVLQWMFDDCPKMGAALNHPLNRDFLHCGIHFWTWPHGTLPQCQGMSGGMGFAFLGRSWDPIFDDHVEGLNRPFPWYSHGWLVWRCLNQHVIRHGKTGFASWGRYVKKTSAATGKLMDDSSVTISLIPPSGFAAKNYRFWRCSVPSMPCS